MEKSGLHLYRGIVVNNNDPKKGGRCQVKIFELHGMPETFSEGNYPTFNGNQDENATQVNNDDLPWAEVMQPIDFIGYFNANHFDKSEMQKMQTNGMSASPVTRELRPTSGDKNNGFGYNRILEVGTWVFCILDFDNPNYPIIIGTVASNGEYANTTSPTHKRFYQSTSGHFESWNDTPGNENIILHHRTGSEVELAADGNINLQSKKDMTKYAKGNNFETIDGEEVRKIGSNRRVNVGGSETIKISGTQRVNASAIYLNC